MSALGQKQTNAVQNAMSAKGQKRTILLLVQQKGQAWISTLLSVPGETVI